MAAKFALRIGTNLATFAPKRDSLVRLEHHMKRRDFLKSVSGLAAGAMVPAPAIWSAAKPHARSETLLIVSEGGPNTLDITGVATNVPGYDPPWNGYDRLSTHEM